MRMRGHWKVLLAIPGIVLACSSGVRAQSCEPAAASVISVQGDVEVSDSDRARWRDVQLNQVLCAGQQVRLMAKSRAVLQLPNETLVHLDEGSVFTLRAVEPEKPAWLDLLHGALHIISRVPRALNIRTPFVNAGIEGTEFALRVAPAQAELWVYEGRVRFSNPLGQLLIASGEAAAAARGRPPERRIVVKPRRAVEWALYYPPLLDSRPEAYPEALRPAVLSYRRNDFTAAFAALDGVPERARDARYHTLRAGLLLSVGRVREAEGDLRSAERLDPKNGTAYALRSVIAVVRNEQDEALKLAAEAVRLAPGSATPYVARSYAEQSAFEIEKAHESLEKAAELAPEDALVWARLAEIELSRGDLDAALEAATKAETLDPGLSRTQSVLGFAYLTRIEVDRAKTAFERAMALDPADPLPRLGLGLARIRDGDVDEGTKEIEIAASLDPNNSLVRSYLGKAYYEQKRDGLASSEYEQAKLLDPKDPTPWFYDAIRKQTENRPIEALHDLQRSIDLNDNRAVYRSRLLLDEDLAARSANLARIYDNLGFTQRARLEAWKSVTDDPSDFSGHRFLADSYASLQRHEIARVSELLQSQLLQPVNITPLQPQLAETDLGILESAGPSELSFNEFNPLFNDDGVALLANGLVGNNNTFGDDLVLSAIKGPLSGSFGQFHFETDGPLDNNDLKHNIYSAFGQWTVTPKTSFQVELRRRETESGKVALTFDPHDPDFKQELARDSVRAGLHLKPAVNHDTLVSFAYQSTDILTSDLTPLDDPPGAFGRERTADKTEASHIELQHLYRNTNFNLISGFGYVGGDFHRGVLRDFIVDGQIIVPADRPLIRLSDTVDTSHLNAYVYAPFKPTNNMLVTLGLSYDDIEDLALSKSQINPKFGFSWSPSNDTTIRAAAFRVMKRPFASNQTIEPTQLAGFNQFFDDPDGTDSVRYGVGLDQRLTDNLFAGLEVSWRKVDFVRLIAPDLQEPSRLSDFNAIEHEQDESYHRVYSYWLPVKSLALGAEYQYESFDREEIGISVGDPDELRTHYVPLTAKYFHPSGFFASFGATYVDQGLVFDIFDNGIKVGERKGGDNFWTLDSSIGFRLPKRFGLLTLDVRNLTGEEFRFQSFFNPEEQRTPRFQPDTSIFATLNLWFY